MAREIIGKGLRFSLRHAPCAHICRYCLISESRKRSALPFARFERLVHRFRDWKAAERRDNLEIGVFCRPVIRLRHRDAEKASRVSASAAAAGSSSSILEACAFAAATNGGSQSTPPGADNLGARPRPGTSSDFAAPKVAGCSDIGQAGRGQTAGADWAGPWDCLWKHSGRRRIAAISLASGRRASLRISGMPWDDWGCSGGGQGAEGQEIYME